MVNLTETFPKGTVGSREIKAAYFATQTPLGIECCRFLCIDERAIPFPAEMGYKTSRAFGPGDRKVDVGKSRCRGRLIAFGLKGRESLNDCFVAETVETQAEVALRLQK
jgi:hypothetical protein